MSAGRMSGYRCRARESDAALFASLEGGTVVSVGTSETAEEWMGRVQWLEIRRADGSVVVVECWKDDEGNGPGALWFNVLESARGRMSAPAKCPNCTATLRPVGEPAPLRPITRGPWETADKGGALYLLGPSSHPDRRTLLAEVHYTATHDEDAEQREGNAALMIAAPDLLAACEAGADLLVCDRDNDDPCTEYPGDGDPNGDCNPCAVRRLLWAAVAKARGGA